MAGFAAATEYGLEKQEEILSGTVYQIACMTWFTSTGHVLPKLFKFQDDAGELQIVRELSITYEETRNYSGIPSREYGCRALIGGMMREFRLIFYIEACKWVMVV